MTVKIRRLSMADLDACVEVASDRGWTTPRAYWSMLLEHADAYGLDDGERLLATVTAIRYDDLAFVGMMLVRESMENKGIGRTILTHALTSAPASALIATSRGKPLYEKVGFVEREQVVIYEGSWQGSVEDWVTVMSRAELTAEDIDAIVKADILSFGYDRRTFLRAVAGICDRVAFDRTGGYAISTNVGECIEIGPIIADDDDAAIALVAALAPPNTPVRLRVPSMQASFRLGLAAHGLSEIRSLTYMTFGAVAMPEPSWYGIGLPSTG